MPELTPPRVPSTPRFRNEIEAMLRTAVVETHGHSSGVQQSSARRWQVRVLSPVAAVFALVLLATPMMLRTANVAATPETVAVSNLSPSTPEVTLQPVDAGPVELGAISPGRMLVDGHRDPHRAGFPGRLLPGIGYR